MVEIRSGDFGNPQIVALLKHHFEQCHAVTPPGSAHVFDLTRLDRPDVDFFAAWEGESLLGVGAVKYLGGGHGEVKSMHTAAHARRRGVGALLLAHIVARARARGMIRLSLETGSFAYFAPAVALYKAHGFRECPPFGDYKPDPNSLFLTLQIA